MSSKERFKLLETEDATKIEPKNYFCWQYGDKATRSVVCFGAEHLFGLNEQAKKIIEVFYNYAPDCIVVESYKNNILKNDFSGLDLELNGGFEGSESLVAISLGLKSNINILCGEPTDEEEITGMLEFYEPDQVLAFVVMRGLYHFEEQLHQKVTLTEYFDKSYDRYLISIKKVLPGYECSKEHIFETYKKWFGENIFELSPEKRKRYVWPVSHKFKWQTTNEMAKKSGDIRDTCIIEKIYNASTEYKKIFVVYGKSHIPRWESALKEIFKVDIHGVLFE